MHLFEYLHFVLCRQCVDLSCNELNEITLPENLPPKLQELDLTGNPRLSLDHKTLEQLKYVIIFHKIEKKNQHINFLSFIFFLWIYFICNIFLPFSNFEYDHIL